MSMPLSLTRERRATSQKEPAKPAAPSPNPKRSGSTRPDPFDLTGEGERPVQKLARQKTGAGAGQPSSSATGAAEGELELHLSESNKTGYLHVNHAGSRFRAEVSSVSLGYYDTAVDAAAAVARHLHLKATAAGAGEEQEQEQEQDQGVELQESKSVDAAIPCSSFMENPLAKRTSVSSDTTRNAAVARLEESRRSSTAISGSFIGRSMYSDSAATAATAAIVKAAPSRTTSTEVGGLESPFACENSSSEDISPVQQLSTYSESRRSAARQSIQANVEEIVSGKEQQKNKSRRIKKFFSAHTSGV